MVLKTWLMVSKRACEQDGDVGHGQRQVVPYLLYV